MITGSVALDKIVGAPWRISEDLSIGHEVEWPYTAANRNILRSLTEDGQLSPIHVRPFGDGLYQVVDGHLVVDAARKLGLKELDCVIHPDLDDNSAMLRYFHLNLNRIEVERDHVRIQKLFDECGPSLSVDERVELLEKHCSWKPKRVRDYVEIHERGKTWRNFTYVAGLGKKKESLEWE
jgi:hypothetical protein